MGDEAYYQTELLDLKEKDNYKFILNLLFNCQKPAPSLAIKYCYYQEFGPEEKFEEMKKALNLEGKIKID